MDADFSVRSRLMNNRKSLNVTVEGGATEFRCGTRTVDSRFFEPLWETKISWSNWVDWGKGNDFWFELSRVTTNRGPERSGFHLSENK